MQCVISRLARLTLIFPLQRSAHYWLYKTFNFLAAVCVFVSSFQGKDLWNLSILFMEVRNLNYLLTWVYFLVLDSIKKWKTKNNFMQKSFRSARTSCVEFDSLIIIDPLSSESFQVKCLLSTKGIISAHYEY